MIDVENVTNGYILRILLNADLDQGLGMLSSPDVPLEVKEESASLPVIAKDEYWRWRLSMAKKIASEMDANTFGVKGFYLFGSTKSAMAGPGSDIDVIIHFHGNDRQKKDLLLWLDGWSRCLSEMNYLRTGYKTDGLLDVHLVSDEEVKKRSGYAAKIEAVTDAARKLTMKNEKINKL